MKLTYSLVESGCLALKFNKVSGLSETVHSEGWNWKLPYFERAIIFDVKQQPRLIECKTGSKGNSTPYLIQFRSSNGVCQNEGKH